jgi:hypothetical protein
MCNRITKICCQWPEAISRRVIIQTFVILPHNILRILSLYGDIAIKKHVLCRLLKERISLLQKNHTWISPTGVALQKNKIVSTQRKGWWLQYGQWTKDRCNQDFIHSILEMLNKGHCQSGFILRTNIVTVFCIEILEPRATLFYIKGTQAWEIFWLWFCILYYFIVN